MKVLFLSLQRRLQCSGHQWTEDDAEKALGGHVGARAPIGEACPSRKIHKLCRNFEQNHLNDDLNVNSPGFFIIP